MDVTSHYGHVTSKTPIHQASLFLLASERSNNVKPTAWLKIQISTGSPEADPMTRKKTTTLRANRPPKQDLLERSEQRDNQRSSQTDQNKEKGSCECGDNWSESEPRSFFLSSQEMRVPPFPHRSARAPLPPPSRPEMRALARPWHRSVR